MCVILFSYQPRSNTPLILGANRDEFFSRPAAPLQFWEDQPDLLAGKDLQAGGTWLGITRSGRFAAVTNVREPSVNVDNLLSRGELTRDFLVGKTSPKDYLSTVLTRQQRYSGFNLLVGCFFETNELYYLSNRGNGIEALTEGVYGLSNHLLDSPWPKVIGGKEALRAKLNKAGTSHQHIRQILESPRLADDHHLPSTGISYQREKALSAMFITLPDYGTRASTVLTIHDNHIACCEQSYQASHNGTPNRKGESRLFTFEKNIRGKGIQATALEKSSEQYYCY